MNLMNAQNFKSIYVMVFAKSQLFIKNMSSLIRSHFCCRRPINKHFNGIFFCKSYVIKHDLNRNDFCNLNCLKNRSCISSNPLCYRKSQGHLAMKICPIPQDRYYVLGDFEAPQPVEPWTGLRDATKEGNDCYSRHFLTQTHVGSEDCLFLNVYSPQLPTGNSALKPVMVWVHGGGFINGSGSTEAYGPEFLVAEDVVLVTLNYRLGLLGFAYFEDPALEVFGNAGLKDQVFALKWVQQNISKFGGDPDNVTIFGESAGGACVHLLMLSPMANGLFHRVIAQSGVGITAWSRSEATTPEVAKALNLKSATEADIFKILNKLPVEKLLEVQEKLPEAFTNSSIRPFGPVVESQKGETAFLPEDPLKILKSGKYNHVPCMIGYTSREGMLMEFALKKKFGEVKWITDYEKMIPYTLNLKRGSEVSREVAEKIKMFYYGNEEPSHENMDQFYLMYTDTLFFVDINNAVCTHTKTSHCPTYYYRMSVETKLNIFKKIASVTCSGTCHGDDIGYLFKNAFTPEIRPKSPEEIALKRILKLWTTFAKYGDPNPVIRDSIINVKWPPTEEHQLHFLDIGENLTVGINPETTRAELWDEILELSSRVSKL